MAFEQKTWQERQSSYPSRRTLTYEDGSTAIVTLARNEGTIIQEGDAFSEENMNDLEERIGTAIDSMLEITLPTSGWSSASSIISGYYQYIVTVTTVHAEKPIWSLVPANGKIPTDTETDCYNDVSSMYADADAKTLTFYASTVPTTALKIAVKGVS